MTGGAGWSFEEDGFLPLDDARDILIARRIEINEKTTELTYQLKTLHEELAKVEYGIKLTKMP